MQAVGRSIGYVIVIRRSNKSNVLFYCDRSGIYNSNTKSTKKTRSIKINCGFEVLGKCLSVDDDFWMLMVICDKHNHEPALFMEGHAYARRLSENETELVKDMKSKNVKPRDILSTLKKQNVENVSTVKTIYNACQKFRNMERKGKTQMQLVLTFLEKEGYIFYNRANTSTDKLEELFFAHPRSLDIWRAFPHVLLMDATYNTNRYGMPLLEIVGVTPTNRTFCIAFVFMHKEKTSNYIWAIDCLKSFMNECMFPRVIVTDRELALMKACDNAFPNAKKLLCRVHINRNIIAKYKRSITQSWSSFYTAWTTLVRSQTEESYINNLAQLEVILSDYPGII